MNNRALTSALIMAGIAVFFVQSYVSSVEEEAKKKFGTEVLVVIARRDIKEMETVNETLLEFKLIPKRFLEPAAISLDKKDQDKESSKAIKGLSGTVAIVPIKKGEQITYNKITEPSMRTGLAPQIAPGRRALSIPIGETSGVSKLIKPGDRVDLIAVIDGGGGKTDKIAKTILQDVIILSIGRYVTNNVARVIEADGPNKERVRPLAQDFTYNSVTLELEPSQAQLLALVMANGDNYLTLSLRNNDDSDRIVLSSTMLIDVLGSDAGRVKGTPGKK